MSADNSLKNYGVFKIRDRCIYTKCHNFYTIHSAQTETARMCMQKTMTITENVMLTDVIGNIFREQKNHSLTKQFKFKRGDSIHSYTFMSLISSAMRPKPALSTALTKAARVGFPLLSSALRFCQSSSI